MSCITFDELSKHFNLKLEDACREIQLSSTTLKKVCRDFNVPRWPYRKLKSLHARRERMLKVLREEGAQLSDQKVREQLALIEKEIQDLMTNQGTVSCCRERQLYAKHAPYPTVYIPHAEVLHAKKNQALPLPYYTEYAKEDENTEHLIAPPIQSSCSVVTLPSFKTLLSTLEIDL